MFNNKLIWCSDGQNQLLADSEMGASGKPFTVMVRLALLVLILVGFPTATLAGDPPDAQPPKPFSEGTVKGSDFVQPPPKTRPKDDEGNELKAELAFVIEVDRNVTTGAKLNPDGTITITTTSTDTPKTVAQMDREQSWIDPAHKDDKDLLDHEQGHMDTTEKNTRDLQAEFNKKQKDGEFSETKTLPAGTSEADRIKEMDDQANRVLKKIDDVHQAKVDKNKADNEKYDEDTDHGTDENAQVKTSKAQKDALKKPNTDEDKKKGANADSQSDDSIDFNALAGLLTIDEDFLVGFNPLDSNFVTDLLDPALGAEMVLPDFSLIGEREDGSFFFTALGTDPQLGIVAAGGETLFSTDLPYLVYDPVLNLFFGLGGSFEALGGESAFVDHLVAELTGDELALFGIEFLPDLDFADASANFTVDATSSFTNGAGARRLPVSEPAILTLFGVGLLGLLGAARQRKKQVA